MKRILRALFALVLISAFAFTAHAYYSEELAGELENMETASADEFLSENNVDISDPESIKNVSAKSILGYFGSVFKSALIGPLKILIIVLVLSLICQVTLSISSRSDFIGDVFVIVCFLAVSPFILSSFSEMMTAVKSQQAFMASYIPIFAAITAASGNIGAATSYNALVLYAAEGVTAISTLVLKPMLSCMLVMACLQAVNRSLPDLTGTLKRAFTGITGVIMTVFVGVISLQTVVGRAGGEIALKAGKYIVSSFVPVIGMSLSESYKTVKVSISAMRSAVGAVGIVVIVIILSVPIITMWSYKLMLMISEWVCQITGSSMLASLVRGLSDVYSLCVTLLLIYALMFIISTGVIIILGSEAYI